MSTVFTKVFTDALKATPTLMTGVTFKMYLFTTAPSFENNDSRYTTLTTINGLVSQLGWGNYLTPVPPAFPIGVVDNPASVNRYVINDNLVLMDPAWKDSTVAAAAFEITSAGTMLNKLAFITNRPFSGQTVMRTQDGVAWQINPNLGTGTSGTHDLFSWNLPQAVSSTTAAPVEGAMVLYLGPPDFEPAKTQHAWIYPQRVNLIANPSFEKDVKFWRSQGTLTRASGFAPGVGGGVWYGHLAGKIIESNTFPVMIRKEIPEGWTIQLQARGDGELKVGLVTWPASFEETVVDWGPDEEVWNLNPTNWQSIRSLRRLYDVSTGMIRLETNGTFIDIDHVCAEPGFLPASLQDWGYFDGDTTFGGEGDYTWYGDRHHASYSCWVNHRQGVMSRLFAWDVVKGATPDVITDEEARKQGLVYSWVPAGTPVVYHQDRLFIGDPQTPVSEPVGAVLPYKTGAVTPPGQYDTDLLNLKTPW